MTYTETPMAERLDALAELIAQIRPLYTKTPRPTMARLDGWARTGELIDAGRGATFVPSSAGSESYRASNGETYGQTVIIYGTATFRDRTDRAAAVHITERHAWLRSSAWTGSAFVPLPEGASKRIAAAVSEAVGPLDAADFAAVGAEHFVREHESNVSNEIATAHRALESALRKLGGAA